MKNIRIGSNQALWHLSCLEKFQFIRSKKIGNRRTFFKFDSNPEEDEIHYYLKVEVVQTIIKFIEAENKALKITEIADGLKKNHNTIKKYLEILIKLNIIQIEKKNNRNLYIINQNQYSKFKKLIVRSK